MTDFLFSHDLLNSIWRTDALDVLMVGVTALGYEFFYTLLLPLILWSGRKKYALYIAPAFTLSVFINATAKVAFTSPRPSLALLNTEIHPLYLFHLETGNGLPSGHTQGAVAFYFLLAMLVKNRLLKVLLFTVAVLMPFSRLYMGVHFAADIIAGILLAAPVVFISYRYMPLIIDFHRRHLKIMAPLWVLFSVSVAAIYNEKAVWVGAAAFSGTMTALPLLSGRLNMSFNEVYRPAVKVWSLILLALAVFFVLRVALKAVLPDAYASDYIRYFLLFIYAVYIVPPLIERYVHTEQVEINESNTE